MLTLFLRSTQSFATHLPEHASRAQQYLATPHPAPPSGATVQMTELGSEGSGVYPTAAAAPAGRDGAAAPSGLTQRRGGGGPASSACSDAGGGMEGAGEGSRKDQ